MDVNKLPKSIEKLQTALCLRALTLTEGEGQGK